MTRDELLDRLQGMGEAGLEEVIYRLGVRAEHLPSAQAPLTERAVALLRVLEAAGRLEELERVLERRWEGGTGMEGRRGHGRMLVMVGMAGAVTLVAGVLGWWGWQRARRVEPVAASPVDGSVAPPRAMAPSPGPSVVPAPAVPSGTPPGGTVVITGTNYGEINVNSPKTEFGSSDARPRKKQRHAVPDAK